MARTKELEKNDDILLQNEEETPQEETKLYKFKSLYKTLICYIIGAEFKDHTYQTTDEKTAEALRKIKGVTEVTEE